MNAILGRDVLTTGEIARICSVSPKTVSKWFDSGDLSGYRIPGGKDRRVLLSNLIHFMKRHGLPLHGLVEGQRRVLIVDQDAETSEVLEKVLEENAHYQVEFCAQIFTAGMSAGTFRPQVMLLNIHLSEVDASQIVRQIKSNPDLQLMKVIAVSDRISEQQAQALLDDGFDGFLRKPFRVEQVLEAVEDALAPVY